jgi:dienelactone hydrolase
MLRSMAAIAFLFVFLGAEVCNAAPPRALPEGQLPKDKRLNAPKDLNGYFPFTPPKSLDEWNVRAEKVRQRMLVALGLWPMPTSVSLEPVVHGKIERPEYTVDKVYFESYPGFFVTGNLYRPKKISGKVPGILVPHGHHINGRFVNEPLENVNKEIAIGAERFVNGGKHILQAMCVQLARMGCIAFHYDMVGYADSTQIPHEISHKFATLRPNMDRPDGWGFFSTQAELRCQNIMGLQTYNSFRALDFLLAVPDVDPSRIGVTGASGGGTQTMILGALDPRVKVTFPVVMVSTAMQGGCTCENTSLLRIGVGNVDFAALAAPKPQGIVAADDWTRELGTKGLPELKELYKLYGKPDDVMGLLNVHFKHNYNHVSRTAMYGWFNKYFNLGLPMPVLESDFEPLTVAELSVWDDAHPSKPSGEDFERELTKRIAADDAKQIAALTPHDEKSLAEYRRIVGGGFDVALGGGLPAHDDLELVPRDVVEIGPYFATPALLRRKSTGAETPILTLAANRDQAKRYAIWLDENGKQGLLGNDGLPKAEVRRLLDAGTTVVGIDLLFQGEYLKPGEKAPTNLRRVENPREALSFTLCYNNAPFAERVQDVLSLAAYLQSHEIDLIGFDGAGRFAAAAAAQAPRKFHRVVTDVRDFHFVNLSNVWSIDMLPGAVKYGDIEGLLSLVAPTPLWMTGESSTAPPLIAACYSAAGKADAVTIYSNAAEQKRSAAIDWLLQP